MASRKHTDSGDGDRRTLGRKRDTALFPAPGPHAGLPADYPGLLDEIKRRIQGERLRTVMAANAAMVLLYWDIGSLILERQDREGWGVRVIDRLSADLCEAFSDMHGLSPRNLKYMRAFAAAWRDRAIVQEALAQITWYHNLALLERLRRPEDRLWYARQAREFGGRLGDEAGREASRIAAIQPADGPTTRSRIGPSGQSAAEPTSETEDETRGEEAMN